MTAMPAPTSIRIERRDMYARRMMLRELLVVGEKRVQPPQRHLNHLAGVAHDGGEVHRPPVSRFSSPRKRCGPWTAITRFSVP